MVLSLLVMYGCSSENEPLPEQELEQGMSGSETGKAAYEYEQEESILDVIEARDARQSGNDE